MKSEKRINVNETRDRQSVCGNAAKGIPVESLENMRIYGIRSGFGEILKFL